MRLTPEEGKAFSVTYQSSGYTLSRSESGITIAVSPLVEAKGNSAIEIANGCLEDIKFSAPTRILPGSLTLTVAAPGEAPRTEELSLYPGDIAGAKQFVQYLEDFQAGRETPAILVGTGAAAAAPIPGLNFVAVDIETANNNFGSVCQVGLVEVIDGTLTREKVWLCKPPVRFAGFLQQNINVHGITEAMVADAPEFAAIASELVEFIGGRPLIAHFAQFDLTGLSEAFAACDIPVPHWNFGCTVILGRNVPIGQENNQLPTLARVLGVSLENHHDALDDARAAAEVAVAFVRRDLEAGRVTSGNIVDFFHSHRLLFGSVADVQVDSSGRAQGISQVQLDRYGDDIRAQRAALGLDVSDLILFQPGSDKAPASARAAKPAAKKSARPDQWSKYSLGDDIPEANLDADPSHPAYGKVIVLTGDFAPFDKNEIARALAERGATIGKGVTKKTNVLILGAWKSITTKQKKAEQLRDAGQEIEFWAMEEAIANAGLSK